MKFRHLTGIAMVTTVVAMIAVCYLSYSLLRFPGDRGPVYDVWGSANEVFQVRIKGYHEVGIFMPGAFYSCESALVGSDEWREFKEFRGDDAIPVRRFGEQIQFVDANTAIFYTADAFLITRDSGRRWSEWKPMLAEADGSLVYWAIIEARIESDGTGKAKLRHFDQQIKKEIELEIFTRDHGKHWTRGVRRQIAERAAAY